MPCPRRIPAARSSSASSATPTRIWPGPPKRSSGAARKGAATGPIGWRSLLDLECTPGSNVRAMARFKVGVQLRPQHCEVGEIRAAWEAADELGVDSIWTWDHFYPLFGEPDGEHYE